MASAQPSGSRAAPEDDELQDEELTLAVDNEAAEIARLQLPPETADKEAADERIAQIDFRCTACDMHELVHYVGREPPFALGVQFREDNYVMRDPFQAPPPRWQCQPEHYISLGAKCASCGQIVCKDPGCSFYYTRTYCLPCGRTELKHWPVEAQARLRKHLAAKQNATTSK